MIPVVLCLAFLAPPGEATPAVDVLYRGTRQAFSSDALDRLAKGIGDLAIGSGFAAPLASIPSPTDLAVVVRYSPPLQITLRTPAPKIFAADQLALYDDDDLNDGWPLLVAASGDDSWSLGKYSGGQVLDLLCSAELAPLASRAVTSTCPLAPSRRSAPGGSPDPSPRR